MPQFLEVNQPVVAQRGAVGLQRNARPVAAVDRIPELGRLEAEIVVALDGNRDLLDRARAPVAARAHDRQLRLFVVDDGNEIFVADLDLLAVEQHRHEILAVVLDRQAAAAQVAGRRHGDRRTVDNESRARQRLAALDLEPHFGADDGTNVVTRIFGGAIQPGPVGVVVGQPDARDFRQVDDVDRVLLRPDARGGQVVGHGLAHGEERKLEGVFDLVHRRALPVAARPEASEQGHRGRVEALGFSADAHVAAATDGSVAGLDRDELRRQGVVEKPAGPEIPDAITPVARTDNRGAEQRQYGNAADDRWDGELEPGHAKRNRHFAREAQRIFCQERQERRLPTGRRQIFVGLDTAVEIGGAALDIGHGTTALNGSQRDDEETDHDADDCDEQHEPCRHHELGIECPARAEPDGTQRQNQRGDGEQSCAARNNQPLQPLAKLIQVAL